MIQLSRARTADAIPAAFHGPGRLKSACALIDLIRNNEEPKASVWKAAKAQLKAESGGKCAYCESSTSTVAHGDVEHFRPKSTYWWLAYCFDNYTFACQICNQIYKGSNFPRSGPDPVPPVFATPFTPADRDALAAKLAPDPLDTVAVDAHRRALAKEEAHLPDPYASDPEMLFAWSADDVLREVEVRPRTRRLAAVRGHAAAESFLGLNRDELRRRRYEVYAIAKGFADIAKNPDVPASAKDIARTQLRAMVAPMSEYAGMVRYFVAAVWRVGA